MSSVVEILCPNGRRETVKVKPITTLLNILEEVCEKQKLEPIKSYGLIHNKKNLDLSLLFRYTGLPNHAKLEISRIEEERKDCKVTIALQLQDGSKIISDYSSSETLWKVIETSSNKANCKSLFECPNNKTEALVFMTTEIVGGVCLKTVSLHDLGLYNGRATIRYYHKTITVEQLEKLNNDFIESRKRKLPSQKSKNLNDKVNDASIKNESSIKPTTPVSSMAYHTRMPLFENEIENYSSVFGYNTDNLNNQQQQKAFGSEKSPKVPKIDQQQQQQSFHDFKFPEETKGQTLYKNELSTKFTEEKFKPCEREICIFDEKVISSNNSYTEELEDEFFEVTVKDVQNMFRDLKSEVRELCDKPLITKGLRQLALEEKINRYERAIIRFIFPNHIIIQSCFRPREKVQALYEFILSFLDNKNYEVELYTTPPKVILNCQKKTLAGANLVPLTKVFVKLLNVIDEKNYISNEMILFKDTNENKADSIISHWMSSVNNLEDNSIPNIIKRQMFLNDDGNATGSSLQRDGKDLSDGSYNQKASTSHGKIPTWFKQPKRN